MIGAQGEVDGRNRFEIILTKISTLRFILTNSEYENRRKFISFCNTGKNKLINNQKIRFNEIRLISSEGRGRTLKQFTLQAGHNNRWVLNGSLDFAQEQDSLTSIDDPVVVGESNVHHGANLDLFLVWRKNKVNKGNKKR